MNILKDLVNRVNEKVMIKTVLGEETYYFMWNAPATAEDIQAFENRNECSLPDDYKESLLISMVQFYINQNMKMMDINC